MTNLFELLNINITEDMTEYGHNGVKIEKQSLADWADWQSFDTAEAAGLIPDGAEDWFFDGADEVFIWKVDGDYEVEWHANFEDAKQYFEDMVSLFYDDLATNLDDHLADNSTNPRAWMYEGVSDEDRKVSTDQFTDYLAEQLMMKSEYVEMTREVSLYIVNESKRTYPFIFATLFAEYRGMDSDKGNLNIYVPDTYKDRALYLAEKLNLRDQRGNPSISSLFRDLIDKELSK